MFTFGSRGCRSLGYGNANEYIDLPRKEIIENPPLPPLPADPRTKRWFLSDTPGPLFIILGTYLYFCLYAGPRFMKDRKPFQLKSVLIWYNAIQVILSVILVWEGLEGGWRRDYSYRCQPVDYTDNPVAMRVRRR